MAIDSNSTNKIQGTVSHDAVDSGNPVKIGGKAVTGSPSAVADGDRVDALFDELGKLGIFIGEDGTNDKVAVLSSANDGVDAAASSRLHTASDNSGLGPDGSWDRLRTLGDTAGAGLGVLSTGARTPGSSEVKTLVVVIGATSASRATFLTPSSGKKVRVLSFRASAQGLTTDPDEVQVYFGTGAAVTTNAASIIGIYDTGTDGTDDDKFPEGAGPIGAADAVVSWRTQTETETGLLGVLVYREE